MYWTVLAAFGVGVTVIAALVVFSIRGSDRRAEAVERVAQTSETGTRLEALLTTLNTAESSQRGFLLKPEPAYLEPYHTALSSLPLQLEALRAEFAESPSQLKRLEQLEALIDLRLQELAETIRLVQGGRAATALAELQNDRGKNLMDQIRGLHSEMSAAERDLLEERKRRWGELRANTLITTLAISGLLLMMMSIAAILLLRNARARQLAGWVTETEAKLVRSLQDSTSPQLLGQNALDSLADWLDAQAGAFYVTEDGQRFTCVAAWGQQQLVGTSVGPGEGLVGQVAIARVIKVVSDVPRTYLVSSGIGSASPRQLVLVPLCADATVHGVLELGFFTPISTSQLRVLKQVSEPIAIAVRTSKDRRRITELLDEARRQTEALQRQQEALRLTNEELARQGESLRESRRLLEQGQAEVEGMNGRLVEQQLVLKRNQRELAEKATELEKANRHKSEFLANMSHELRTPLNSALILARILSENRDGNLSTEQVKYAATILSAGNDLLALINDVLDLSKIEAGKLEITAEPFPLAALVENVEEIFQPVADQRGLTFAIEVDPLVPEMLNTDRQRVQQVLSNLLSNAFKFTPTGRVSLAVRPASDDQLEFCVTDTGIGIDPSQHEAVFAPFRQAGRSNREGGTGLGLSISRTLAEALGGEVLLRSQLGLGSVFTLRVPRNLPQTLHRPQGSSPPRRHMRPSAPRSEPLALPPPMHESPPDGALRGHRLMIVEDDLRNVFALKAGLEPHGALLEVAHNGAEALRLLLEERNGHDRPIELALMDIMMPEMDGLEAIREIRSRPALQKLPIIALTAKAMRVDREECLRAGANDYVAKPLDINQVVSLIRRWLPR